VLREISRICGFPVERIAQDLRLGSDLGFDSLLAMELHRKLAATYPALAGAQRNLLAQDLTVAYVVRLIRQHVGGVASPIVTEAPAPAPAPTEVQHSPDDAKVERWPELHALEERALDLAVRGQDNP
jgi:hypothetical protein